MARDQNIELATDYAEANEGEDDDVGYYGNFNHYQRENAWCKPTLVRFCIIALMFQCLFAPLWFASQDKLTGKAKGGQNSTTTTGSAALGNWTTLPPVSTTVGDHVDNGNGDAGNPHAVFNTTMGVFTAELFLDRMPITVSNFIDLCQSGFYAGLHFHRVIDHFMIQFGCPYSKDPESMQAGRGGPPERPYINLQTKEMLDRDNGRIKDEFITYDGNEPGTLSMANTGQPNSGGSQFFINVHNNSYLNWWTKTPNRHPVFGKVIAGYDAVVAISRVPRTDGDRPLTPIMMYNITIAGLASEGNIASE
mmetsp:Transcript_31356/g.73133  ORF Transcript_31356/g.73133 Transcript_31356/m.73133 type:complete len:307 (+) Transcript_31356:35-955(+)